MAKKLTIASNQRSSCLSLLNAGITGAHHHIQLSVFQNAKLEYRDTAGSGAHLPSQLLRRLKQENCLSQKFHASLGHQAKPCLKKKNHHHCPQTHQSLNHLRDCFTISLGCAVHPQSHGLTLSAPSPLSGYNPAWPSIFSPSNPTHRWLPE
jgi:hypothetical protein